MNSGDVLDVAQEAIYALLMISGPILAMALVVGLIIAFFQALTQIQEMTLTFVPKIFAVFGGLLIALPFMGQTMSGLMERLVTRIIAG